MIRIQLTSCRKKNIPLQRPLIYIYGLFYVKCHNLSYLSQNHNVLIWSIKSCR